MIMQILKHQSSSLLLVRGSGSLGCLASTSCQARPTLLRQESSSIAGGCQVVWSDLPREENTRRFYASNAARTAATTTTIISRFGHFAVVELSRRCFSFYCIGNNVLWRGNAMGETWQNFCLFKYHFFMMSDCFKPGLACRRVKNAFLLLVWRFSRICDISWKGLPKI